MAHHGRYQRRTMSEKQHRVNVRAFIAGGEAWDDAKRARRLQGVKRRRFIRRINEFVRRLMDPNDPSGKRI